MAQQDIDFTTVQADGQVGERISTAMPKVQANFDELYSTKVDNSRITISADTPSGGSDGDIWFQIES